MALSQLLVTNSQLPPELLSRRQWIAWWSVAGEGRCVELPNRRLSSVLKGQPKPHKLPINPHTGGLAASTRSATWSSFQEALAAAQRWSLTGIGFVFTDSDSYSGVDMDHCRNPETGQISDWACAIIRALNSYSEVSPSGTGIHTIIRGNLPAKRGNQVAHEDGKVEMFSRARYFTFTGIHVDGTPTEVHDRQPELLRLHDKLFGCRKSRLAVEESRRASPVAASDCELIAMARKARNGSKFARLWSGRWEGDYISQSEADLALCCLLAFWTGQDAARIDELFQSSGMMRKKWLRTDYREATMAKAITMTGAKRIAKATERRGVGGNTSPNDPITLTPETPWDPPIAFHQFQLPDFPVEVLPDWLRAFVEALATATQTPADLAALLTLSVIAASCAKKVVVCVKGSYCEPVNLFTVTALPSGSRKSSVFAEATRPLEDYEQSEARRTGPEMVKARATRGITEARLKKLQERAVSATGKDQTKLTEEVIALATELAGIPEVAAPRLIADDCTPERLVTLLRDQGGRIAVMSPEGDVFDLMAGRYSSNKKGNFGVYLKGHAGDALYVDRIGRPMDSVKAPALTIGLAVQPDVIRGLAQNPGFRGRGLLARFLYAMPDSFLGRRDTKAPPVPIDVCAAYRSKVLALLNLPVAKDEVGDRSPHVLLLDSDAGGSMQQFEAWLEPQLSEFGELGGIADWAGKLVGAVARIAGNLHMAEFAGVPAPWRIHISKQTVEGAIRIGKVLIPHAKAAFSDMGADEVIEKAKHVLRWIKHKKLDSFSKRELHQALRGNFRRVTELDRPLVILVNQGFIRIRTQSANAGAGRPSSPTYDVNPLWVRHTQQIAQTPIIEDSEDCE